MLDDLLEQQDIYQWQYDKALEEGTIFKRFIDKNGLSWETIDKDSFNKSLEIMKDLGYDGIFVDEGDGENSYFVFNSNQIKNVDNTNPTKDSDIRFAKQNALPLDKNFKPKGTKTRLGDIKLPGVTEAVQEEVKAPKATKNKNLPFVKEEKVLKLDPNQIADALNGNTKEALRAPNGKKVRKWSNTSTNSDVLNHKNNEICS